MIKEEFSTLSSKNKNYCEALINIRKITTNILPIGHSFIPYDILLLVMHYHHLGQDLTIKKLLNSGIHSDMGIRYHLKRLIEKDWVSIDVNEKDQRVRILRPTTKLHEHMDLMAQKIEEPFAVGLSLKIHEINK